MCAPWPPRRSKRDNLDDAVATVETNLQGPPEKGLFRITFPTELSRSAADAHHALHHTAQAAHVLHHLLHLRHVWHTTAT